MSASVDAISAIKAKFSQITDRPSRDCPAVDVPNADIVTVLRTLRDEGGFDLLSDLTAIDWAEGASPRFTAVYHLFRRFRTLRFVWQRHASARIRPQRCLVL